MYNHMDYSSDERHDYCIFDDYGIVRWRDGACSPQEPSWFFAGRRSEAWSQACAAELAGPALPLLPHVDCHRTQAVIVWGTLMAPLTNT
jgi:hypothetical protein